MSAVPNLGTRRQFYIYQLIRLTNDTKENLEKKSTNELQDLELQFYRDKYGWTTKEYVPSTL